VLPNSYENQRCSLARALEMVGERWTLLVIRDLFCGLSRFDDLQASTGVARNVLTNRLDRLVENGLVAKRPYQERPVRHEYELTDKGNALWRVMHELLLWGDRFAPAPEGRPTILTHRECGGEIGPGGVCERCGERPASRGELRLLPGPGAPPGHPVLRAEARRAAEAARRSADPLPA